jgi:hypothetical protein
MRTGSLTGIALPGQSNESEQTALPGRDDTNAEQTVLSVVKVRIVASRSRRSLSPL